MKEQSSVVNNVTGGIVSFILIPGSYPRDAQRDAPSAEVAPEPSSLHPWLQHEVALLPHGQKASGEERQVMVRRQRILALLIHSEG